VGATQRLPRVLGKRLAKDMMFTGRTLSADDALAAGLVSRIVAPDALEDAVAAIAATIAKAPPAALALAKRCIDEGLERDPRGALATELMAIEESLAAAEWRRAMAGFGDR
jgi:enoyl-CoA hydratase